jgi:hypothetical protein
MSIPSIKPRTGPDTFDRIAADTATILDRQARDAAHAASQPPAPTPLTTVERIQNDTSTEGRMAREMLREIT